MGPLSLVLIYKVNPLLADKLVKDQRFSQVSFKIINNSDEIFKFLETCKVIFIGEEERSAVSVAQEVQALKKSLRIIFLYNPEDEERIKKELFLSPSLGHAISSICTNQYEKLSSQLDNELRAFGQRAKYKELIDASNIVMDGFLTRRQNLQTIYFDKFLDNVPIGIMTTDEMFNVLAWNRSAGQITGEKQKTIVGTNLIDIFASSEREKFINFTKTAKEEMEVIHEITLRSKNKKEQWLKLSVTVVKGYSSLLFLFSMQDVTYERAIEMELRRSENQFRTYIDAMPEMAYITNNHGELTYFNKRFYDYIGFRSENDTPKWKYSDIIHPEDISLVADAWYKSLKSAEKFEIEFRIKRFDGEYRWHLGRAVPIRDEHQVITQWLGTNTDINDQKETAQRLKDALNARDEFLSIASHELNTPLSSLRLNVQLRIKELDRANSEVLNPALAYEFLEKIDKQISRIVRLVGDMLDITRIRTGRLTIEKSHCELAEVVREVVHRYLPDLQEKGIECDCQDLDEIFGEWDKLRLEQAIINLLTNAIRYGAGKPLRIRLKKEGQVAHLTVEDQGMGISPEIITTIFHRFERAQATQKIAGLGLGLFITREIIEAHQGKIWAESPGPNKGSTFHVTLPI